MNLACRRFMYLAACTSGLLAMSSTVNSQSSNQKSTLAAGGVLNINDALISPNGANLAILNSNCDIAVSNGGTGVWVSAPKMLSSTTCFATMQPDGNFVIYAGTPRQKGPPLWFSGTSGSTPFLTMQDDGNLVIYNGTKTWATNTTGGVSGGPAFLPNRSTLAVGEILTTNESLVSSNGYYVATMQGDGNFVVKLTRIVLWASDTQMSPGNYFAAMHADGLVVLFQSTPGQPSSAYSARGTSSPSPSPFFLTMQDDGNLVIYKGSQTWSTAQAPSPPPPPVPPPDRNLCRPPAMVCNNLCVGQPDNQNCGSCGIDCTSAGKSCEVGQDIFGKTIFVCGPNTL